MCSVRSHKGQNVCGLFATEPVSSMKTISAQCVGSSHPDEAGMRHQEGADKRKAGPLEEGVSVVLAWR